MPKDSQRTSLTSRSSRRGPYPSRRPASSRRVGTSRRVHFCRAQPFRESKVLRRVLQARGRSRRAQQSDVAPVPPHSLVADVGPEGVSENRAGAARARKHFDDFEHLYARSRRRTAKQLKRSKAVCSRCSRITGWARKLDACTMSVKTQLRIGGAARI
jgi:hypothetical protein